MKRPTIPEFPTHVVHAIANWVSDGEFKLAFMHEGKFFCYERGAPIIEYAGDKVLMAWELKPELAMHTPVDEIEGRGTDTVKFCYQCDAQVTYLFADARCAKCTRVETEG